MWTFFVRRFPVVTLCVLSRSFLASMSSCYPWSGIKAILFLWAQPKVYFASVYSASEKLCSCVYSPRLDWKTRCTHVSGARCKMECYCAVKGAEKGAVTEAVVQKLSYQITDTNDWMPLPSLKTCARGGSFLWKSGECRNEVPKALCMPSSSSQNSAVARAGDSLRFVETLLTSNKSLSSLKRISL